MFSFFKRSSKEKSCKNCAYFKKGDKPVCTKTNNSTLKAFPFKNTKCKTYKEK